MKKLALLLSAVLVLASCASTKEMDALKAKYEAKNQELVDTKANLQRCLIEKKATATTGTALESKIQLLENQIKDLRKDKDQALKQVENLTVLTQSSSDNIKNVISQLSEKDKYINGVRDAMSRKDSLNLAIKYHLTKNLSEGIQDKDIEVNVEKTVVFISISDKLLFNSGSATISSKADTVLEKIAKVVNDQPEMDVMIEGHTDSTPINNARFQDNWDLSTARSTAIIRKLQNSYGVAPERLIAAGRSSYIPLAPNDSYENRAKNRRTKIIIMPRLNQFFELLEQKP